MRFIYRGIKSSITDEFPWKLQFLSGAGEWKTQMHFQERIFALNFIKCKSSLIMEKNYEILLDGDYEYYRLIK